MVGEEARDAFLQLPILRCLCRLVDGSISKDMPALRKHTEDLRLGLRCTDDHLRVRLCAVQLLCNFAYRCEMLYRPTMANNIVPSTMYTLLTFIKREEELPLFNFTARMKTLGLEDLRNCGTGPVSCRQRSWLTSTSIAGPSLFAENRQHDRLCRSAVRCAYLRSD
jgi:hypothetical protein